MRSLFAVKDFIVFQNSDALFIVLCEEMTGFIISNFNCAFVAHA